MLCWKQFAGNNLLVWILLRRKRLGTKLPSFYDSMGAKHARAESFYLKLFSYTLTVSVFLRVVVQTMKPPFLRPPMPR